MEYAFLIALCIICFLLNDIKKELLSIYTLLLNTKKKYLQGLQIDD